VIADRRGTTVIEVAIVFPVLVLMLLGIIEFGRALWTQNSLQYAVEQAARCASVDPVNCATDAQIQAYAVTQLNGIPAVAANFTPSKPSCGRKVAASLPFTFVASQLLPYSLTLTAWSCRPT
jgi:Flp pilus assembly protein TadG